MHLYLGIHKSNTKQLKKKTGDRMDQFSLEIQSLGNHKVSFFKKQTKKKYKMRET